MIVQFRVCTIPEPECPVFLFFKYQRMKKVMLLISLTGMPGLMNTLLAQQANVDFRKLDWLEGTWTMTNVKSGRSAHEIWQKISSSEWSGLGVNMKGSDTVFVEKLKLLIKDGNIFYIADIVENKEPVYFKFTSISNDGFVCENPKHDFPKKISYQKDGEKIMATISGDGKSIEYLFEKKKP